MEYPEDRVNTVPSGIRLLLTPRSSNTPDGQSADAQPPAELPLDHGDDPHVRLADLGWAVAHWGRASLRKGALIIEAQVERIDGPGADLAGGGANSTTGGPAEPSSEAGSAESPSPYQRVAGYGLIVHRGRVLLTQLAASVPGAGGRWTLPGGGLDDGEEPEAGTLREVWEETGQRAVLDELLDVDTSRWVGSGPAGRLEDFHAVRLIYRAHVPEPTDLVIHDVGGSTADVRWADLAEIGPGGSIDAVEVVHRVLPLAREMSAPDSGSDPPDGLGRGRS